MKAIQATSFGAPDVLSLTQLDTPVLKPSEVLIDVEVAGVGTVDVLIRRGLFPGINKAGFVPGMEIAGTISAVGELVTPEWIGRRVYAMTTLGGYAEQVAVPEPDLVPVPDSLTGAQALSLGINALVAHYSLQRAGLSPGDRILVRGAGGGVGAMVAQLALAAHYDVTVTDTTALKRAGLAGIGVQHFFAVNGPDAATQSFKAIIDPVAGPDLDQYVAHLAENGTYVLNGAAAGFPPNDFGMSWLSRFQRSLTLACLSLNAIPAGERNASLSRLFQLAIEGKIRPLFAKRFALEEAAAAHQLLESGTVFGKIVLGNA